MIKRLQIAALRVKTNDSKERITALRARMKETGIDAYLIPTDDFHGSEYVGEYFKCRKYITGFTGSAGTAFDSAGYSRIMDEVDVILSRPQISWKEQELLYLKWVSRKFPQFMNS